MSKTLKRPEVLSPAGTLEKLKVAIDSISDEEKLKACLNLLHGAERMPCCYTEDELDEVVRRSEAGGYASTEEVHELFAKWGVYM